MSSIEELEKLGILKKGKLLTQLKRRARARAKELKTLRAFYDARARVVFRAYIKNGRSWKGIENQRTIFRSYMTKRHKLHTQIAQLVPEKVEPEWDSP